jgi:tetratricopeptide (TPR) repeat protein
LGWRSSIGSGEGRPKRVAPRPPGVGTAPAVGAHADLERLLDAGGALYRAGKWEESARAYGEAAVLAPADFRPLYSLAILDVRRGRQASARERLRRVVGLDPRLTHAWRNLAAVCQDLGLWSEAASALRRAADLDPADADARFALGAALITLGRTSAGLKLYHGLAAEPPLRLRALARIAVADPHAIVEGVAEEMATAAEDTATPAETRTAVWFALGAVYEARGADDAAFAAFASGNRLKRQALEGAPPGARPQDLVAAHAHAAKHVARVMTAETLAQSEPGAADLAPIFIVGIPRSGSSLVEQILASHREVIGLGETAILPRLLERAYPAGAGQPFAPSLGMVRAAYLAALNERGWDGRRRFVDKTLENFLHVGAIRLMFPHAVILNSVRDPVDTCVGCWRQLFNQASETLYDLDEIAAEYAIYAGMMDHWRKAGAGVVDVSLEVLVADPDHQIRRLVTEVCGLEWDPATLRFWAAERAVRTASATQVRRPISASGLGRWRRYEAQLGGLLETLRPFRDGATPSP